MKHIAAIAIAACSLVASADEIGGDAIKTLCELSGIELSEPWTNATTRITIPKPIGGFRGGYVYTNAAGRVHQINLRHFTDDKPLDEIRDYLSGVERDLVEMFPGARDFVPRRGRPEYEYGMTSSLPGGCGWHIATYADVMGTNDVRKVHFMLTFWNPRIEREGAAPATGDRGAAPVRASP